MKNTYFILPKKQRSSTENSPHVVDEAIWNSAIVTIRISGKSNYLLAGIRNLYPHKTKALVMEEILEQAIKQIANKKMIG